MDVDRRIKLKKLKNWVITSLQLEDWGLNGNISLSKFLFSSLKLLLYIFILILHFIVIWFGIIFIVQDPLTEEEIEELIAEFLEVESKVLYFHFWVWFLVVCMCVHLCTYIHVHLCYYMCMYLWMHMYLF